MYGLKTRSVFMKKRKHKVQRIKTAKSTQPLVFYLFFGFLVLVFPVFYLPQALDRTLAPRLLALAVLLFFCVPLLFNKERIARWDFSIWRQMAIPLWFVFFLLTAISAFFADNHQESYLFIVRNFLFASGLSFAALILYNTSEWQAKLPKLFIVSAFVALGIGIIQYVSRVLLSSDELLADGTPLIYAVTGVFSHKNFFSSVLILMLPFTAFGIYRYRNLWQLMALLSSAGILMMILILRTRSIWVGLMAGILVASIVLLGNAKGFKLAAKWRMLVLAGLLAGVAGVFILFNLGDASDEFSVAGRVRSIFDTQSRHNIHRIFIWNASMEIIKEEPITGVGAGNWLLHIPKHFNRNFEHLEALGWRQPHNDYIWIAAEQGILALLVFIAAFVVVFFYLFRVIRDKGDNDKTDNKVLALLLMAGVTAFLADAFFSFPYERVDVMVFLMIIIGTALALYHKTSPKPVFKPKRSLITTAGLLFFSFSAFYAVSSIRMEQNMREALKYLSHRHFDQVLHYANAAKTPFRSLGPHLYPPEFLEGVAHQNQEHYRRAVASFEEARRQAPYDIRILHLLGSNYRRTEQLDHAYDCFMKLMRIYPPSPSITEDVKRLVVDLSNHQKYQQALDLLTYIPGWEDDAEISRNVRALETLMQRQTENQ